MRLSRPILVVISALCLVASYVLWQMGDAVIEKRKSKSEITGSTNTAHSVSTPASKITQPDTTEQEEAQSFDLVSTKALTEQVIKDYKEKAKEEFEEVIKKPYRLSNAELSLDEMIRRDSSILLENALIDTDSAEDLNIPGHLQSQGPVGAYIVQFEDKLTSEDYELLDENRGDVISYIPNNALLVKGDAQNLESLDTQAGVKKVIPWEPYFKLKESLLESAVDQQPLDSDKWLNVLGFPGTEGQLENIIADAGAYLLYRERSPFGPSVVVDPINADWVSLAQNDVVMAIEPISRRELLNDISRFRLGVAPDTLSSTNYLELTGQGIPVNVNDTGVDGSHPDLAGRVFPGDPDDTSTLTDANGHGTHVAGSIASSGLSSPGPDEDGNPAALGSDPDANFRGMAPEADIYPLPIFLDLGPTRSDAYLIETIAELNYVSLARTNPIISNNSWGYVGVTEYSSGSAAYDQAVRDAMSTTPGDQPIVYVFAAGNEGNGSANGQGGNADSIRAPGNAKNVITVGAIESFRNITNDFTVGEGEDAIDVLAPFLEDTDTDNQVANFSSRGNTGVGIEGLAGRFKPDVVAPGHYIVSTRSGAYADPTVSTDTQITWLQGQTFIANQLSQYSYRIPNDATDVRIEIMNGTTPLDPSDSSLPIYAVYGAVPTENEFLGDNFIDIPGDIGLQPGAILNYAIGNNTGDDVVYAIRIVTTILVPGGDNDLDAQNQLNAPLAPHYRFLSGTSMATPVVSGVLALISEYLKENNYTQSPALLKALLINGSRTVNNIYSFSTEPFINYQGWGVINLTNTLPATTFSDTASAVQFVDQSIENSLGTGEEISWDLEISEEAIEAESDLKITLVWTDPPGNPSAGVKLVNDLDLMLTNHNSTNSFLGNDFPDDSDYVLPTLETSLPDTINNVENIFIRGPLSTNYTVTVKGSRINVNAVRGHENKIAQDFALVVSTTDTGVTNAVTVTPTPTLITQAPDVTTITNGVAMLYQRASANSPILGSANGQTNQWKFYTFTNTFIDVEGAVLTNGANVAFTTFLPPNLSNPQRNLSADVDLYVSRGDAGLLTLNPTSLANADKSTNEGGTEQVVYTDAALGEVFYVGVKAEDQKGAEFSIIGISTDQPFSTIDEDGNHRYPGFPVGNLIADGTPLLPGFEPIIVPGGENILMQNVRVEVSYFSENFGDILGNLSHNNRFVVLNNHSESFGLPWVDGVPGLNDTFIYDDSNSGEIVSIEAVTSDGPGDLTQFLGESSGGPWIFNLFDNALNNQTRVTSFEIVVEELLDLNNGPINGSVLPQRFEYFVVDVPTTAVSLEVFLSNIQPPNPLELYVRREVAPTLVDFDKFVSIPSAGGSLTLTPQDSPPLNGGRYFIGVYNPNFETINFTINTVITDDVAGSQFESIALGLEPENTIPILDHAVTESKLAVEDDERIADVRVGVRIDHDRVSDLSLRLKSPQGDTYLLSESRGGVEASYLGSSLGDAVNGLTNHSYATFTIETNIVTEPLKFVDPPFGIDTSLLTTTNRILVEEDFQGLTNRIYMRDEQIGQFFTTLSAVEVLGDDDDRGVLLGTRSGRSGGIAATFKTRSGRDYLVSFEYENQNNGRGGVQIYTNRTLAVFNSYIKSRRTPTAEVTIPIRARSTETTFELRSSLRGNRAELKNIKIEEVGILDDYYVRPEESLESLFGKRALGEWTLLVSDDRAGGDLGNAKILDWKMEFLFANPDLNAITLTNGVVYSGILTNGQRAFFKVPVPRNATIATNLLDGEGDLVLLGDRTGIPTGALDTLDGEIDYYEDQFGEDDGEFLTISTNTPFAPLEPGQVYYLGVDNADPDNTEDLEFQIRVTFDADDPFDGSGIPELFHGVTISTNIPAGPEMKYWRFFVEDEEIESIIDMIPTENADLFVSKGRPPTFSVYDLASQNLGSDPEQVSLVLDPEPSAVDQFAVSPGYWYVGIVNRTEDVDIQLDLTYTETFADITDLVDSAITSGGTLAPETFAYYRFTAPGPTQQLLIETINASADLELVAVKGPPVPSFSRFDFLGTGDDLDKTISIRSNLGIALPGDWYIAVYNVSPDTPVTYDLRASSTLATITDLENKTPYDGELGWLGFSEAPIQYFRYDVSGAAERLRIELENFEGPDNVDLIITDTLQNGLPSDENFQYISNAVGLSKDMIDIRPNSLPAPLHPGEWFIAVIHRGEDGIPTPPPTKFRLTVTEIVTEITELFSNTPVQIQGSVPGVGDYFKFTVFDEALAVRVNVTDMNQPLDVYLRKGSVPTEKGFDAFSENPGILDEAAHLSKVTGSVLLTPGEYFVWVAHKGPNFGEYEIKYEELFESDFDLVSNSVLAGEVRFLGQFIHMNYTNPSDADAVMIRTPLMTEDFDIYASRIHRYPDVTNFEFSSNKTGTDSADREIILIDEDSQPNPLVTGQTTDWFITLNRKDLQPEGSFELAVDPIYPLEDVTPRQVTGLPAQTTTYFRIPTRGDDLDVSRLQVRLTNPTGDVTLKADETITADGARAFGESSDNPNTEDESLVVDIENSTEPYVYISVENETGSPVDFTLEAEYLLPEFEMLVEDEPRNEFQRVGRFFQDPDHFKINVPVTASKATIRLYNISTGFVNGILTLKKGRNPLPSFDSGYDYISNRITSSDEFIVIDNTSDPVPLSPGEWYVTVEFTPPNFGNFIFTVRYSISLEFEHNADPGSVVEIITPSVAIENGELCLNWESIIGSPYRVEGLKTIDGTEWESVATLVADQNPQKYCIPIDDINHALYRIVRLSAGDGGTPEVEIAVNKVHVNDSDEICVVWASKAGRNYQIEKRTSLTGDWEPQGGILAGTGQAMEMCFTLDPTGQQFFRVLESTGSGGGTPDVNIAVNNIHVNDSDEVCVVWTSNAGRNYQIEKRTSVTGDWEPQGGILAGTGQEMEMCFPLDPTGLQFFRVLESSGGGSPIPPNTEIEDITAQPNGNEVSISWQGVAGVSYRIEGKKAIGGEWETVKTGISGNDVIVENIDSNLGYLLLRVMVN